MGQEQAKSSSRVDHATGQVKEIHYVKKLDVHNPVQSDDNTKATRVVACVSEKCEVKVPENPLNSYVESYLRRLFKKFDTDKDNNLNPKEMKNLIVHLTGRKISKDQTRLFLESIDENNDALIQRQELVDFVTSGINLTQTKRQKYAKRSKLHSIILDFFDVCKKNLHVEREALHVEVKLTSSEEDERPFYSATKAANSSDESSEYERHFASASEDETVSTQYSVRVGSIHSSELSHARTTGEYTREDYDAMSDSSDDYGTRYSIYLESVRGQTKSDEDDDARDANEEAEAELKNIFDDLDVDKDGELRVKEFHKALFRRPDLGTYIRPRDVRTAFAILGIPLGQNMSFPDFQRFCLETRQKHQDALQSRETLTWVQNLRSLFWRFGADRHGNLTLKKLRRKLLLSPSLGHLLRAKEIDEAIAELNLSDKGFIKFHTFKIFCLKLASAKKKGNATNALKLLQELDAIFRSLDVTNVGSVTVKEIRKAFKSRPDILRYVRPAKLRNVLEYMSIPLTGTLSYDNFEKCVLAARGGVNPDPEIFLDNVSSLPESVGTNDQDEELDFSSQNSSVSDDETSASDYEDNTTASIWKNRTNDGISINYSEIALTDFRTNRSVGKRDLHRHTSKTYASPPNDKGDNRSNFALDDFDMDEPDEVSVFSFESSGAGKSRWSLQSHTNSEELYAFNAPNVLVIGSSSEEDSTESQNYNLDTLDMTTVPGNQVGEHVKDFELVDD